MAQNCGRHVTLLFCFVISSDHPRLRPKSFLDEDIYTTFSKDYMFFGCIQYINKVSAFERNIT